MCADIADLSRDEAKRILRRLELEAYSAIVSAFRAQGELGRDKKKLLNELGTHLCISTERHRAEVRRAYSDDRLLAISESVYGPGSCAEWAAEGRRTVPLMPRLVPQTVLSATATAAANTAAASNAKLPASSSSAAVKGVPSGQNSANSSPGGSTTSSASSSSQQSVAKPSATSYNQQASSSQASDTENEGDSKMKKRRRLSTNLAKPVPRIITPSSSITKPITKTASVSTMTKVGKPVVQTTSSTKPTQKGTLSASASQVKLLTKTVAITPTLCQAKTVLTYKTVQAASSSPVKVQTVMSSAASKTQIKPAHPSVSPSKSVLVPKPHGGAAAVSKSVATSPGITRTAGNSPTSAIKLGNTTSQLAARQRLKPTRFKTLPGTVKFKSVTPVTVGTSSVVTMVTPSPGTTSSSGSSILKNPVSTSQPYLKVIQVPVTGVVGTNKPVVVMSTGLNKTAISSAGTTPMASRVQQAASSTTVVGQSVLKVPISIAPATAPQSSATTCVTSSAKSVVMTTVVGGTKRIVLSVPAYSLAQSKPVVTSGLAAAVAAASVPRSTTTTAVLEADSSGRGQELSPTVSLQPLGVEAMPLTQGSTQIMPKQVASTLTTQVRSRPLPAILPAPPKPTVTVSGQPGSASATSGTVRKLAPILPAPAKNVTVIQPVLLPVVPVTASAGQLGASLPVVLTSTIPSTVVTPSDTIPVQSSIHPVDNASLTQEPVTTTENEVAVLLGTMENPSSLVTGEISNHPVSERSSQKQTGANVQTSLPVAAVDQSVADVEPNSSSEDDALLLCSETLDISSAVQESTSAKPCMFEASAQEDFSEVLDCLLPTNIEQNLLKPDNDKEALSMCKGSCQTEQFGDEEVLQKESTNNVDLSGVMPSLETVFLPDTNDATVERSTKEESVAVHGNCKLTEACFDSETESSTADSRTLDKKDTTSFALSIGEHKMQTMQFKPEKLLSSLSEGNLENSKNSTVCTELECGIVNQGCTDTTSNKPTETRELQACGASKKEESTKETKILTIPEKELKQLSEGPSVIVEKFCDIPSFSYCTSELLLPLSDSEKTQQLHPKQFDESAVSPDSIGEGISINEGGNGLHLGEGVEGQAFLDPNYSEEAGELIIEGEMCKSSDDQESHESLSQDVNVDILSTGSSSSSNDSADKEMTEKERRTLEAIASVRTSGRKRKAPMALDVSPPRPTAGWIRSALSLLQKVCSYRGQGRRKGDFGAASWFLRPVDPSDAPGYYKIIKTPMDFGTIRAKLESGQYQQYTDFYADMLLVKTNCQKYNPPGHEVRQDCDEVFKFFEVEYAKILERWEKCHTITVSPAKKVKVIQPKLDCATK